MHRLTAPADQKPVVDWLKANAQKDVLTQVTSDLANLPTGTAWVCSGEARLFERVQFPRIKTYDNSATPTGELTTTKVHTAPVDVAKLREIVGEAVKDAEANDPARLKAEVVALKAKLAADAPAAPAADAVSAAKAEGYNAGYQVGHDDGVRRTEEAAEAKARSKVLGEVLGRVRSAVDKTIGEVRAEWSSADGAAANAPISPAPKAAPQARAAEPPDRRSDLESSGSSAQPSAAGGLDKGPQAILAALSWWRAAGIEAPELSQVSYMAGYSRGGTFDRYRSSLRSIGLIDYPQTGRMALTREGLAAAPRSRGPVDLAELQRRVIERLPGPVAKILAILLSQYPKSVALDQLASGAGYSRGGTFDRYRSTLSSLEMATYPANGEMRAADWLFPKSAV